MSLFDDDIDDAPSVAPDKPESVKLPDTSSQYVDEAKPILNMDYQGDPWTVTFYSQVLDTDDHPQRLDLNLSPTIQQYVRFNDFVILQTTELSAATDNLVISEVSGSATMYPAVVPNNGDHFVARMSDNRYGLFVITNVERTGYYNLRTWNVDYDLVDYMSSKYQTNLDLKTIDVRFFDKENPLGCGDSSQKRLERYQTAKRINELVQWWWDEFYDLTTATALFPPTHGYSEIYDPQVVEFMTKIMPSDLYDYLPKLRVYDVPSPEYKGNIRTIWDILIDNEDTHLRRIKRYVAEADITAFRSKHVYTSVGISQVDTVLIPEGQPTLSGYTAIDNSLDKKSYVFSDAFYDAKTQTITPLEATVLKSIMRESFTAKNVIDEIEPLYTASKQQQFYRIPVLIWLLLQLV